MDSILIQQNPHWSEQPYRVALHRDAFQELLPLIDIEEMLILLGVRRSGKSTLFKLIINHLLAQAKAASILYINFDDPAFTDLYNDPKKLHTIVETAEKITGTKVQFLFLDEVQNVVAWEKFVKSSYDSQLYKKIFITGSNSRLLSSQYATLLTGRYIKHQVYPLSFREILSYKNIEGTVSLIKNKPTLLRLTEQLIRFGSYPNIYLNENEDIKRKLLISYYEAILFKDCIQSYEIRNTKMFVELTHYLISNPGCSFSYNKLANSLGCSDNTIKEFIHILEQSYLIKQINHFSFSLHSQAKGKKKCYISDNGFIYANAFQFIDTTGRLFENLVFTELQKKYGDKIYFYNEKYECDFIVQTDDELIGIQVCYQLTDENRERETRGLLYSREKLKYSTCYLITFDQQEHLDNNISIIPFWKFF